MNAARHISPDGLSANCPATYVIMRQNRSAGKGKQLRLRVNLIGKDVLDGQIPRVID
jgi:hypothetical protein